MGMRAGSLAVCLAAVLGAGAWKYAERPRIIEGTWLYMFEGSEFFERRIPGHECNLYRYHAAWLNYDIRKVYQNYSYKRQFPSSGAYRSVHGAWRLEAFEVRFEGRKRLAPLGAGHLRSWASEYDVERMLSVRPIRGLNCDVG